MLLNKWKYLTFLFLLLDCLQILLAQEKKIIYSDQHYQVYPLSDDWQVYDENYGAHVPYIENRHKNSKTMSFWLDLKRFEGFEVVFYAYEGIYLMINNNLCKQINREGWQSLKVDSLREIYSGDQIFFTVYDKLPRLPLPALFIGYPKETLSKIQEYNPSQVSFPKTARSSVFKYFITLQMLLLGLFYTSIFNYQPRALKGYFDWRSSLSRVSHIDPGLISKSLSGTSLLLLGGQALVLAFVFEVLWKNNPSIPEEYNLLLGYSSYLQSFLWIILLIALKYLILSFLGIILNIDKGVIQVHFFEYFRLSGLFYGFLAIILIFLNISFTAQNFHTALGLSVLFFHIIQAFLVSFYVLKQIRYKSLYLFYYLCITELVPLMVGMKFLLFI